MASLPWGTKASGAFASAIFSAAPVGVLAPVSSASPVVALVGLVRPAAILSLAPVFALSAISTSTPVSILGPLPSVDFRVHETSGSLFE